MSPLNVRTQKGPVVYGLSLWTKGLLLAFRSLAVPLRSTRRFRLLRRPSVLLMLLTGSLTAQATSQIPDSMFPVIEDAGRMSIAIYGDRLDLLETLSKEGWNLVSPGGVEFPTGVRVTATGIIELPSGLHVGIWERTLPNGKRERVIAFRGTKELIGRDGAADVRQFFSGPEQTPQYQDALDFVRQLVAKKDKDPNLSIMFTGHSLGGGIAQFLSLEFGVKTVVFNAAPLNLTNLDWALKLNFIGVPSILDDLDERVRLAFENVWNLRLNTDLVSASPGKQLGRVFSFAPVRPTTGQWSGGYPAHNVDGLLDAFNFSFLQHSPAIRILWTERHPGESMKTLDDVDKVATVVMNAKRVLIAGTGPAVSQLYSLMVKRVGPANILWIKTYSDETDVQAQARAFGADAIFGVRPPEAPVQVRAKREGPQLRETRVRPYRSTIPPPPPCPPSGCGGGGGGVGGGQPPPRPPSPSGAAGPNSSTPPKGGIDLSGKQKYSEHQGIDKQFDKDLTGAEIVPSKKKREPQ